MIIRILYCAVLFALSLSPFIYAKTPFVPFLRLHQPTGWTIQTPEKPTTSPLQHQATIIPDPTLAGLGDIRFYSQRVTLPPNPGTSLTDRIDRWIAQDFARLKKHIPTLTQTTRYDLVMGDGGKAIVTQLHGGAANIYEAVAYRADDGGAFLFLVILTCRDEVSFIRALPWFRRILGSSDLIDKETDKKNHNPYDELKTSLAVDAQKQWGQHPLENLKKITLPPGFEEGFHHTLPDVSPATTPLTLPDRPREQKDTNAKLPQNQLKSTPPGDRATPVIDNTPKTITSKSRDHGVKKAKSKPKTVRKSRTVKPKKLKKKTKKRRRKKKSAAPSFLLRAGFSHMAKVKRNTFFVDL